MSHQEHQNATETAHASEQLLSLSQAAKRFPGRGRKNVSATSIRRWIGRGVPGPNGQRIRLRAVRLASQLLTSDLWIQEFLDQLATSEIAPTSTPVSPPPNSKRWLREAERAGRRLQEMGA